MLYHVFGGAYAGLGVETISGALGGTLHLVLLGFALKIISTAVSLEAGGSGGIITPLFFIGSTAGFAFARLFHLPVGAFAAFGFVAVVAAAANTPIAAAVMGSNCCRGRSESTPPCAPVRPISSSATAASMLARNLAFPNPPH